MATGASTSLKQTALRKIYSLMKTERDCKRNKIMRLYALQNMPDIVLEAVSKVHFELSSNLNRVGGKY